MYFWVQKCVWVVDSQRLPYLCLWLQRVADVNLVCVASKMNPFPFRMMVESSTLNLCRAVWCCVGWVLSLFLSVSFTQSVCLCLSSLGHVCVGSVSNGFINTFASKWSCTCGHNSNLNFSGQQTLWDAFHWIRFHSLSNGLPLIWSPLGQSFFITFYDINKYNFKRKITIFTV